MNIFMGRSILCGIVVLFIAVLASCGSSGGGGADCAVNNTAQVDFQNSSATNKSYDVVVDGSIITSLAPGAKSKAFTESAGVHTIQFKVAGTNTSACAAAYPDLAQCSGQTFSCSN